jgi:hypothetical protein
MPMLLDAFLGLKHEDWAGLDRRPRSSRRKR